MLTDIRQQQQWAESCWLPLQDGTQWQKRYNFCCNLLSAYTYVHSLTHAYIDARTHARTNTHAHALFILWVLLRFFYTLLKPADLHVFVGGNKRWFTLKNGVLSYYENEKVRT
jgi:hypothetical protein